MDKIENQADPYIGIEISNSYVITEYINKGKIGTVYKAERSDIRDVLACKIIPVNELRGGWEKEIEKVNRLRGVPNIVPYHSYGTSADKNKNKFLWVLWDFINGPNLREYIKNPTLDLDIAFIESIIKTILHVLFACQEENIQHGDLHEGNILIKEPDRRIPGSPRTIWVSDFGYGGSHNRLEPKNDFHQLFSMGLRLLKKLKPFDLNPRDKVMHRRLDEFLKKKVMDSLVDIAALIKEFEELQKEAELNAAAAQRGEVIRNPGDYLTAEALGHSVEEWKNLFVPEFLAAQDLLSRNITVLTGARGCGKTMVFRRLTAFMDKVVNEPSGVKGADQFVGLYLNCRDLAEAFPWLPPKLNLGLRQQIMHFFHLAWFSEICKTLSVCREGNRDSFEWLNAFLARFFNEKYKPLPQGADILKHIQAFIEKEKEHCRLTVPGKKEGLDKWPFARLDFLGELQSELESNVAWIGHAPLYFFLDDYTIPIIPRQVQVILNQVVFNRSSKIFFKISTESTNSFDREGIRGKPLELYNDYDLIDLASESLHQKDKEKKELLDKIFKPRIQRYDLFKDKNLNLEAILGKTPWNNNELADKLRKKERVRYYGEDVFIGMWSSDIRIMIQMFTDMLRDGRKSIEEKSIPIGEIIQDKTYRDNGGEFLGSKRTVVDPTLLEKGPSHTKRNIRHGEQLKDIVEAFVNVSRYELIESPLVKNQGRENPKQAFRLEIIDKSELSEEAKPFLESLLRWHIFFQDWRGKSVRGMITPRLYLNRILLPFCNMTFSSHDHIQLSNEEFISLLTEPKNFLSYWRKKRQKEDKYAGQGKLPMEINYE